MARATTVARQEDESADDLEITESPPQPKTTIYNALWFEQNPYLGEAALSEEVRKGKDPYRGDGYDW